MPIFRATATVLTASALVVPAAAAPNVVASIKPLHSLVSMVMAGVDEPDLLLDGVASPHTYALTPSDASALEAADIVFWTGEGLELFLVDAMQTLAADAISVELSEVDGMELLPVRAGGNFEAHEHDHGAETHEHDHGVADTHVWLDPGNAVIMLEAIAETLARADPDNADIYYENSGTATAEIGELADALDEQLSPVADTPFIVFHDAYQYFENRFELTVAGSITISPEGMPGARRVGELRERVRELGVTCVFAEPQFKPAIVAAIIEGTDARTGVLDPEGGMLAPGAGLYHDLMRNLANSLTECLAPSS